MNIILLLLMLYRVTDAFSPHMLHKPTNKLTNVNKLTHCYTLCRPNNIPYEFSLPLIGSYITSTNINTFVNPNVLLLGVLSVLIGSNSMIINDYFDYKKGVDSHKKDKILTKGLVSVEEVLNVYNVLNIVSFIIICIFVHNELIKKMLSLSIIISYVYTPYLKPITFIKNISVSFVVTQSLIVGGIVTGCEIYSILPPAIYLFNLIMWQEIQLDTLDIYNDRMHNILTIPVKYGCRNANIFSLIFLIFGTFVPLGMRSRIFILLQFPIILTTIRCIILKRIIGKKQINMSRIIMLLSGLHMCLI